MRERYKNINPTVKEDNIIGSVGELMNWVFNATRMRDFDIQDYDNQVSQNPRIYDAPSSSSDLVGTEKVGDIAGDASFFYIVIDNAGTLEWRQVGVSSF